MRSIHHIIHKYHHPSTYLLYGSLGLTVLSGLVLSGSATYGLFGSSASAVTSDMKVAQASVTVSATCSMTANVTSEHNATILNGQYSGDNGSYANGIGSTTINAICSDNGGYAIYAIGYTNNHPGNNKLVSNELTSDYDIVTGTATSGNTSNWAMKVAAVENGTNYVPTITSAFKNGSGESIFAAVPNAYTKVASLGHATDPTARNSSITTTYAAYISPMQPAGTYTGQVAYVLVHPNSNEEADNVYYAMQNVEEWGKNVKIGEEVKVMDSRDGKVYTAARLCMNASNPSACVNGASDENNTNSELWMTENLDLVLGDTGVRTLTSNDSDINTDLGTTMGYTTSNGIITWTPAGGSMGTPATLKDDTPADGANANFVTGWTNSNTIPYQAEGGTRYVFTSGSSSNDTKFGTRWECIAAGHTDAECNHYHIGNYYNWTAAVASNDTSAWGDNYTGMPYYDAANSICPKGWRLPEGLSGSDANVDSNLTEFNRLALAYGITTGRTAQLSPSATEGLWVNVTWATNGFNNFRTNPLYFVRSGFVLGSALYDYATYGFLWSSTARSGSIAFYLDFNSGELRPARQGGRHVGFPVRCIAR